MCVFVYVCVFVLRVHVCVKVCAFLFMFGVDESTEYRAVERRAMMPVQCTKE